MVLLIAIHALFVLCAAIDQANVAEAHNEAIVEDVLEDSRK